MSDEVTLAQKFLNLLQAGMLASFGGVASYLYHITQGRVKFSWLLFAANIILAFFVGDVVGEFIASDHQHRDGLIMVAGFCTYPMLGFLELQFRKFLNKVDVDL